MRITTAYNSMRSSLSAPLSAPTSNRVPKLTQTEDWVESLRVFIRDTLGNKNWQIRKGERDKARLEESRIPKNIGFNDPSAVKARRDWGLSDDIGIGA